MPSEGNFGGFIKVEVRVRRKQQSYWLVMCCTETGHEDGKGTELDRQPVYWRAYVNMAMKLPVFCNHRIKFIDHL